MSDVVALLIALQFGDGQFPSGAFAFSWGLEALIADAKLARADFFDFVDAQLRHRWGSFDRVVTAHAHAATAHSATGCMARLVELDDVADAFLTGETLRTGSRRAGAALLNTHARLATPGAAALRAAIGQGEACGHLPVVQGAMLAGAGLDMAATLAVSAYGLVQAFCSAGIRLGLIGHLDAQRTVAGVRGRIARLVAAPVPATAELHAFTPVAEIAAMRHVDHTQRLFSN